MAISTEGKIGIGLALLFGAGSGAIMVAPTHLEIGWGSIVFSAIGLIILGWYHFFGIRRGRMFPFVGMIFFGSGLIICTCWYFWPLSAPTEPALAVQIRGINISSGIIPGRPEVSRYTLAAFVENKGPPVLLKNWRIEITPVTGTSFPGRYIPIRSGFSIPSPNGGNQIPLTLSDSIAEKTANVELKGVVEGYISFDASISSPQASAHETLVTLFVTDQTGTEHRGVISIGDLAKQLEIRSDTSFEMKQEFGRGPEFTMFATLKSKSMATGVAVIGRFAKAIHTLSDVQWQWSDTKRIIEPIDVLPGEIITRPIITSELRSEKPPMFLGEIVTVPEGDTVVVKLEISLIVAGRIEAKSERGYTIKNVRKQYVYDVLNINDFENMMGIH